MRTFIALELSEEIREELLRLQNELKKIDADVKWVNTENIHLTLKFLGEAEEARIAVVKEALAGIASRFKPFEMSLFKLGAFPDLHRIRVIWVGLDKGCSDAEQIAQSIEAELDKAGFAKEDRAFRAHLTLGRVKTGRNKITLTDKISSLEVEPKHCTINNITLLKSTLTPHGPIYTPLYVAKFMGR